MQRIHDEEHISTTPPPPPYTVVDQYNGANNVQYHTQNPYPATVITSDVDYRLAQKLQDEEYALWVDQNQHDYRTRPGEPPTAGTAAAAGTVIPHHCRPPMPPIPEHSPYNHHHHPCQGGNPQQYPVVYASPIQPPLPYSQTMPYASNNDICGEGQPYYGSMNQSKKSL
ncbi:132_t:CDS:2 [Paraglomus brasilianum]|uniref:132_t:CDS:1 n=1 Tax=Paraglomus brasilianum TaxID=144538 RepID=A0A9N9B996_9GLOM|nr:132_t:CDS:2 [Paraglomus brasilianum]